MNLGAVFGPGSNVEIALLAGVLAIGVDPRKAVGELLANARAYADELAEW